MSHHKLTITGKNISIDEYVTPDFARKIISLLYADDSALVEEPKNIKTALTEKKTKKATSKEPVLFELFCEKYGVRRYCEVVLAAGVYLSEKGNDFFTIKDYHILFSELKGTKATNAPANVRWALNNNWINEFEKNKYKVTTAGKRVLEEKFPDSVRGSTRGNSKKKK